ncbi:purine-nucleoside phosphorylase [bacterium]|nr:purine-nucleoside phosphorylase [bacterium]MBU3955318.1 purine-nucleoside phosphorylase [bacterium]
MNAAEKAFNVVKKKINGAEIALILGSGLGALADEAKNRKEISYDKIPGFAKSKVPGHSGKLISGTIASRKVIIMSGRIHYYEGHPMEKLVLMIEVLAKMGVKKLIVTNAGGAVKKSFKVPSLMLINDHINMIGDNPLIGGAHFIDLSDAYDAEYRKIVKAAAKKIKIKINEGVYLALSGPSYETKAEIRMVRTLGADAVGMSTVPEVLVAKKLGMRVIGISCLTNYACGVTGAPLSHKEVLESGKQISKNFILLIKGILSSKKF